MGFPKLAKWTAKKAKKSERSGSSGKASAKRRPTVDHERESERLKHWNELQGAAALVDATVKAGTSPNLLSPIEGALAFWIAADAAFYAWRIQLSSEDQEKVLDEVAEPEKKAATELREYRALSKLEQTIEKQREVAKAIRACTRHYNQVREGR